MIRHSVRVVWVRGRGRGNPASYLIRENGKIGKLARDIGYWETISRIAFKLASSNGVNRG